MDILSVATLIFGLVNTFGPKAKAMWDNWYAETGGNPTPEDWQKLRQLIESKPPESYD